jgi:hypothetical protein
MANAAIDLTGGGIGQRVGTFTLTTSGTFMCSGHYTLTGIGSDGTSTMTATVDVNQSGCVNADVHISACSCSGHAIHWLADGVIWTKNEGDLTYQHA